MIFAWLALIALIWKIVAGVAIARDLESRGVKINQWAIRIMVYSYAGQYRTYWLRETGRVPGLFYHFAIPATLMWVFVVAAIVASKM